MCRWSMWKAKWAVAKWTHTGRKRAAILRATGSGASVNGSINGNANGNRNVAGAGGSGEGGGAEPTGPYDPSHPWDAN